MAALSAGHFATDFANGALPALLPFFVDRFGLSYTLAAAVMLASTAASSLVQPLFGAWSDRRGAIWLLRTNLELGVYSAVAIAMSLLGAPVDSMPRHAMVAFPVFAFFGARLGHRKSIALVIGLAIMQVWYVGLTQIGTPALAP